MTSEIELKIEELENKCNDNPLWRLGLNHFKLGVEMGKAEAQKEFLDKLEWLKLQFSNTDEDYDDQLFTGEFVKEKIDKFKQSIEGEKA